MALQKDEALVASYDIRIEKSASSLINVYCDRIMADAGISKQQLSAVAVGIGPGSYTGLRIAVSTAKGIAFGLDIPLISVDTLQAMAASQLPLAAALQASICPMLDARRMEVFTRLYDKDLEPLQPTRALLLDQDTFDTQLERSRIIFLGDGSSKLKTILAHSNAFFVPDVYPSAQYMTTIAWRKFSASTFEDVAYLEPYYLKEFVSSAKTLS